MADKKNFDNLKDQLTEQAKQRFTPFSDGGNTDSVDSLVKQPKKQKTIYLNRTLIKLLKKASYIKELDQSEIAAIALERYFDSEDIFLADGE